MLTDDERSRIRAEELFRQEVRERLERRTASARAWAFLNSAFCLWLFSSVVLSVGGWAYSRFQQESEQLEARRRTERMLELELKFRFVRLRDSLAAIRQVLAKRVEGGVNLPAPVLSRELVEAFDEAEQAGAPAFTEFKGRGVASLLIQLMEEGSEPDRERRLHGRNALRELRSIRTLAKGIEADPRPSEMLSRLDEALKHLEQGPLKRWAVLPEGP